MVSTLRIQSPLRQQLLDTMLGGVDRECPQVGIFWYSPAAHDLFGKVQKRVDECPQTPMVTCPELHKHIWQKEFNKQRFKNDVKGPFHGNWKDTPRGRIFYDTAQNQYIICVGSWIQEYPDAIDLIVDQYQLNSVQYDFVGNWATDGATKKCR